MLPLLRLRLCYCCRCGLCGCWCAVAQNTTSHIPTQLRSCCCWMGLSEKYEASKHTAVIVFPFRRTTLQTNHFRRQTSAAQTFRTLYTHSNTHTRTYTSLSAPGTHTIKGVFMRDTFSSYSKQHAHLTTTPSCPTALARNRAAAAPSAYL